VQIPPVSTGSYESAMSNADSIHAVNFGISDITAVHLKWAEPS